MKKINDQKWVGENIMAIDSGSTIFEKTPEEYARDAYANLEYSILEEQKKQDDIIKKNKAKTLMWIITKELASSKLSLEVVWFFAILAIEFIVALFLQPENGVLKAILTFLYVAIPLSYAVVNLAPVLDMEKVAREEIKRAHEKKLNAREICQKRVKEDCKAYEDRYNEWIEAEKSSDNRVIVIYTDQNQIGDIINDSSKNTTTIDKSTHTFSIDTRKIDTDELVNKIFSDEKGLKELVKQIDSLERGIIELSSTLEKGKTRKVKVKEILGDVANVATVLQAATGIANIPELAAYAQEIIKMIM